MEIAASLGIQPARRGSDFQDDQDPGPVCMAVEKDFIPFEEVIQWDAPANPAGLANPAVPANPAEPDKPDKSPMKPPEPDVPPPWWKKNTMGMEGVANGTSSD